MVAYTRVGLEAVENTATTGDQLSPSIAGFADGGFVMVWQTTDTTQDGSGRAIKLQHYDSNGVKVGSEILVNSNVAGDQKAPSVTTLASGGFVVTWETTDTVQDGSGTAIKAQIYDASGAAVGGEFRVNSQLTGNQSNAQVTVLSDGNFAIIWQTSDTSQDGLGSAIKGQIFTAAGSPVGSEFLVNPGLMGSEHTPSLAALSGGGFVATWTLGLGTSADIYAQVFDASGAKVGTHFIVNSTTAFNQDVSAVSQISGGRFVVTWSSANSLTTGDTSVKAQIFASDGTKIGGELRVNTTSVDPNSGQFLSSATPQVKDLPDGGFLITWTLSGGSYLNTSVRAQRYDASGTAVGDEVTINTASDRLESAGDVGVDGNGTIFAVWQSATSSATNYDIRGEIFSTHAGPSVSSNGGGETASVSVAEGQLAVTTVTASNPNGTPGITYSIIGGLDASKFTINASTGALVFKSAPNFEVKSDVGANNVYDVVVAASDGTYVDVQAIAVSVTNVNETPTFSSGPTSAFVIENRSGTIATFTATDPDGTPVVYSLAGADAALFTISASGALSFVTPPNYEAPADANGNNVYDVIVVASDGVLSATRNFSAEVLNENEAPYITSNGGGDTASILFNENASLVTAITVADPDGTTGNVTYSITGGADAGLFTVSPIGQLFFRSNPNFELPTDADGNNIYEVVVSVSDGFNTPDTQALSIAVRDVNEPVVITSNGGGSSAALTVVESSTAVTQVTSTDPDGTAATYAIVGGADAARFTINPTTGALSFVAAPNYEAPADSDGDNVYQVIVSASDGSLSDTQTLSVTVTNSNEAPVITSNGGSETAAVSVVENATAVTTVNSIDPDGSAPSYHIAGGADAGSFAIDAATGALSFITAPDHEAPADANGDNVYNVVVTVSDGELTDSQNISVTVSNANEAPVLAGGTTLSLTHAENATAVTTIVATDVDDPSITYAIAGGNDAGLFAIDPNTGALTFISSPDYEAPTDFGEDNFYTLTVSASDGTNTVEQRVEILVTNENEGVTITSDGGGDSASLAVSENSQSVSTVAATDLDGGALSYAITGGADATKFTIDPATGALSFVDAPNYEAPSDADGNNVYDVVVRASDGELTDTQAIAVTVGNTNEGVTITSAASFALAELSTAIATLSATDGDGDPISWAIVGGNDGGLFTIDQATGALSFIDAPDYEAPSDADGDNVYDVVVRASDGALTDTQAIAVTVGNVNEGVTITSTASFAVTELSTAVATLAASDGDGDPVSWSIVGGNDASLFSIDAETGVLSFNSAPDFEAPSDVGGDNIYDVIVAASDGSLTDQRSLSVTVGNANEAPVIVSAGGGGTAAVAAVENGSYVTTIAASDPEGTAISYSIVGGSDALKFVIDAETGELRFATVPDFEAPGDAGGDNIYDVIVAASDGSLVDHQSLSVTVANVDEAPVIISGGGGSTAAISVAENTLQVTTVAASDPEGAAPIYSIAGGADALKFVIDAETGVLSFISAPNFEAPGDAGSDNIYDVVVAASDGSWSDSQSIAVTVANVADGVTLNGTKQANTLTGGAAEDTISGLGGNDTLNGLGGADMIYGGDGNDRITGGIGADWLSGGAGSDTFVLDAVSESTLAAADVIADFVRGSDKVSLSAIDANSLVGGDQAFAFIGTSQFTNVAGQLRYSVSNGNAYVSGDTNGDGVADFSIQLSTIASLSASDFLL